MKEGRTEDELHRGGELGGRDAIGAPCPCREEEGEGAKELTLEVEQVSRTSFGQALAVTDGAELGNERVEVGSNPVGEIGETSVELPQTLEADERPKAINHGRSRMFNRSVKRRHRCCPFENSNTFEDSEKQ
jgi:hypothetical protein